MKNFDQFPFTTLEWSVLHCKKLIDQLLLHVIFGGYLIFVVNSYVCVVHKSVYAVHNVCIVQNVHWTKHFYHLPPHLPFSKTFLIFLCSPDFLIKPHYLLPAPLVAWNTTSLPQVTIQFQTRVTMDCGSWSESTFQMDYGSEADHSQCFHTAAQNISTPTPPGFYWHITSLAKAIFQTLPTVDLINRLREYV